MNAAQTISTPPEQSLPQLQQRLLHLVTQLDHMQYQLDTLHSETVEGASQVAALTQNLTNLQSADPLNRQIAELVTKVENNAIQLEQLSESVAAAPRYEQLDGLSQSIQQVASQAELSRLAERVDQLAQREQLDELSNRLASQDELANLAKEFKRLSRTQFKTNTLTEGKEQQTTAAISTLQEIVTRREVNQDERSIQERNRLERVRTEARGDLAADLLPTLDGLELAIQNGQTLIGKAAAAERAEPQPVPVATQSQRRSWFGRLFQGEPEPTSHSISSALTQDPLLGEMSESLTAWLGGLNLVRDRFLSLLAVEGIQQIPAQDQAFDPRLHVAVETVQKNDVEANQVVRVIRQGYRQQNRVLRYAEVAVSATKPNPQTQDGAKN